ncbi:GumC family protein [Mastigocoleus testarum]|uniref:non-specific protein-tyrosine kinase n=1 Tax=Mastigocoleus testarum BC008 TaxID=371196 RepID=A0A0V7ZCR1_9CYAN|nr:polysaccharide biosynthesis tyrosine autokinase [Mastigocoleus testarum]KST62308.1 lipopolysaccharide biosynthesis protein [Mastigocoleus testarum BC008]KST70267.1 lipopolysaccharide biosynthesis protein [Mastigocoleus testarum BC008]
MENKGYPEEIDLQKYLLVLKRRWLIASGVFAVCSGLAGLSLLLQKPAYEASGKLLFQSSKASSLTGVGEKIGHLDSIRKEANPLNTQALLINSESVLKEVVDTLKLKDKDGAPLDAGALALDIETVSGTDVLKVSFSSEDPVLAKAVVNQAMNAYIDDNTQRNRLEASGAAESIQEQVRTAKRELNEAAEALRRFKAKNKIINLQEETSGTVKNITKIDEEINTVRSELADLTAREQQIRRQLKVADSSVDIASLSENEGVQGVLKQLQEVQAQIATNSSLLQPNHPTLVDLRNKEANLQALLDQRTNQSLGYDAQIAPEKLQMGDIKQGLATELARIESTRSGLQNKINSLILIREKYRQRADTLPNLEKRQGDIQRRLSVAQGSYEDLLTKEREINIAQKQIVGNASILEYAKIQSSIKALKKNILIAGGGVFIGLLLGVAAAYFVDLIDRRLKTPQEAEALFGHTLLGLIPKYEMNHPSFVESEGLEGISPRVIVATSPRSMLHEAYQMLQANLKFVSLDKKVSKIVVTSSIPGEGRTEVAANLAAVIAQSGKRVLLVDADMRQPAQHHLWGLINSVGLSNVMVGQQLFSKAVQKITPSLSVLTSGVVPPNPLALIDSERMTSFIDMLNENYDYIIFDTPSLAGTADAAVLGKMVDGVLVVSRPGLVDSKSALAAKSLLTRAEVNVMGLIVNAVDVRQYGENNFYYNHSRSDSYSRETESTNVFSESKFTG